MRRVEKGGGRKGGGRGKGVRGKGEEGDVHGKHFEISYK